VRRGRNAIEQPLRQAFAGSVMPFSTVEASELVNARPHSKGALWCTAKALKKFATPIGRGDYPGRPFLWVCKNKPTPQKHQWP